MILNYLASNRNIVSMFMAVDIRRGIEELDTKMINLTSSYNIDVNIIITKADKVSKAKKFEMKRKIENELLNYKNVKNINIFSSKSGEGVRDILEIIEKISL